MTTLPTSSPAVNHKGWGREWIGALKKQTRKNSVEELLALSRENDPFFVGSNVDQEQAEWFAKMWEQEYQGRTGIHIRRVHYHLLSKGYPKLNGMPYRNEKADWYHLLKASKVARLLRLVPADAFDDHRNAEPYPLHWQQSDVRRPTCTVVEPYWSMPSLCLDFASLDWELPAPRVAGYEPDDFLDRAYLLELWIEKSTMDDILVPLARELGIRLVPSSGFQSISNVVKLLGRVREMKKPARLFYISDYDQAGRTMPIAVARQIEFWRDTYAPGADIRLQVLALTPAQIANYHLPSHAEKKDLVELDALEALVPGELEKIVRQAVAPYLEDIAEQLADAKKQAREIAVKEWSERTESHRRRLAALRNKVKSITRKYEKEAKRLNQRMKRDMAPFTKPLAKLGTDVAAATEEFHPSLPARPTQIEKGQGEMECLFDSSRPYIEQIGFYKAQRKRGCIP